MKSTVRVVLFAMLVALLLSSESFGGGLRPTRQGNPVVNRPKRLQNGIASKQALADPLPAGSYTIGQGGNFPTIDSAYRRLEEGGIAGPVTLLLTDTLYVAPFPPGDFRLIGPIAGEGPASRITIRPANNVAVRIEGSGYATLTFEDVSYLTLDGISLEGSTRLKVHTSVNTFYDWNDGVDLWGNCDYDIVQNLTAGSDRIHPWTSTILLCAKDFTTVDSCVVSGVSVTSGGTGIGAFGYNSSNHPRGNVIRECHVGSATDSLLGEGIGVWTAKGTIVENNRIENLQAVLADPSPELIGIESYRSLNTVIRNNEISGFRGTGGASIYGILCSGESTNPGAGEKVYNNMICDLQNRSTATTGYIGGIGLTYTSNALVAFNTVSLSGSSADPAGSDALFLMAGTANATVLNNILVNTCHITSPGGGCTAMWLYPGTYFTSDHNDLLVDTAFANSNAVAQWTVGSYRTLSEWQGAGYDLNSVSVMPPFKSELDVHLLYDKTLVADAAIPISGITEDIDGESRPHTSHVAPDMGADEFNHPTGIADEIGLPGMFSLDQNYPNPFNPSTTISFFIPDVGTRHVVSLQVFDVLGRLVTTLVNERKTPGRYEVDFDASALSSGMYFYRLTAGKFVETRKMVLLK